MKNKVIQYSLVSFVRNLLILFLLLFLCSCLKLPSKPEMIEHFEEDKPFVHVVSSRGETFGAISEWYTGNFDNWRTIAAFNGRGKSSLLRLEDQIVIPRELLTRTEVYSFGQKADANKKKNSNHVNTKSTPGAFSEIKSKQRQDVKTTSEKSKAHDIIFEDEPSEVLSLDKDLDELSKMDDISKDEEYDRIEFINEKVVVISPSPSIDSSESSKYSQEEISDISDAKGIDNSEKGSISVKTESSYNSEKASIEESERIRLLRELLSQ